MATFRIPYGLDSDDRIVHVDDVPRGKACGARCASCDSELVAKKGDVRMHHFAHQKDNGYACEGQLHSTAKRILSQRFTDAIADGAPVPIKWPCQDEAPRGSHEVNLLRKGILNSIRVEQQLSRWNIRPDITLMAGGTPRGLIEVVDTHPPEPSVISTGLPVLEVHVSEPADLAVLVEGTIPVAVMHNYPCPDPICDICDRRNSSGCRYCEVCGKHATPKHAYCGKCKSCADDAHRHRYCSQCDVVVTEVELGDPESGHGDWSHQHCEGCGVWMRNVGMRFCGCLHTRCRRCWNAL